MSVIVLDVEASGRNPGEICQLATLTLEGDAIRGENEFFAVTQMAPEAQAVHGLSPERLSVLSGGVTFARRAAQVRERLSRAELLVGHNIASDLHWLKEAFAREGLAPLSVPTFCTMNRFTREVNLPRRVGRGPKPPRLGELAEYLGITQEEAAQAARMWFGAGETPHDARYDAALTCLCYLRAQ